MDIAPVVGAASTTGNLMHSATHNARTNAFRQFF